LLAVPASALPLYLCASWAVRWAAWAVQAAAWAAPAQPPPAGQAPAAWQSEPQAPPPREPAAQAEQLAAWAAPAQPPPAAQAPAASVRPVAALAGPPGAAKAQVS
jgi:2-oxoglutarate dehydrogenase E2 component (dihydrolipoamide succinyltransferase)